MMLYFCIGL